MIGPGEDIVTVAAAPRRGRRSPIDLQNLRRVDWRVLLPVPPNGFENMVLLGGPEGLGDMIVEIGLARSVTRTVPSKPSANIVAILKGAGVGCEEAAACLLPGGTLYWEAEYPHTRMAWIKSSVSRSLRRANLALAGLYWVRPDFERAELFIPIETRTAMEWYFRSWANTSSPLWRLLGSRFGAPAAAAAMAGRLVRQCAVTAVAGPIQKAFPSILANPAVPLDLRQGGSRPLVINRTGVDASRRVVVLPFRTDSAEPGAVLKFCRLTERNVEIEEEQDIAATIRSRLDSTMQRTIPAPLGTFMWGQVVVGVETYARGRPLSSHGTTRKRQRIDDLRLVTKWLQEFHRQSQVSRDPFSISQLQTWVEGPLDAYSAGFGRTEAEARLFEGVLNRARSLLGRPFPLVWSHPAFSEWNICRSDDDISVIDWEATEIGPALRDLIYFVTLWYYRSGRERGERVQVGSLQELFFPPVHDPLAIVASAALDDYMKSLSIDPGFFPVMLVLTSVARALGRLKRLRAYGDPQSDSRRGNLHVAFMKVFAENHARLFPQENP